MFIPKLYRNTDFQEIERLIRDNGFATLVRNINGVPTASHIPLELELNQAGEQVLTGHVSRANSLGKNIDPNSEALAIFTGAHSYISSSWYDHINVPTWNYIAVHVYGTLRILEGDELMHAIGRLVDRYEKHSAKPVSLDSMGRDYVRKEMHGLIGFEMTINRVEGAWKLSQNRDHKNKLNIVAELEKLNDLNANEIANEMKKNL